MSDHTPAQTTVFQSGNSQAVRLPKEFRFNTKTVEIFRRGDEVVLREKRRTMGEVIEEAFRDLPPLTDDDAREMDLMVEAAKDLLPAEERNWALLSDAALPDTPPAPAASGRRANKRAARR